MKMTFNRMGWLVMAAAFIMSFAACSNDENELNVQPQTIHVSVGAGLGNDGTTRSAMIIENGNRVLTFTEGDRLYVYEDGLPGQLCLSGYLTMKDGSLAPDGKSATFEGDLKVYDTTNNPAVETSYDFGGADPLSIDPAYAYLVHKNMVEGTTEASGAHYSISEWTCGFRYYNVNLKAPDVNTFMESALRVGGVYNSTTKTFELSKRNDAIFNCNISGLTPNQEYGFTIYGVNGYGDDSLGGVVYTTNSSGVASFVFCVECVNYDSYKLHVINRSTYDDKYFPLMNKPLEAKIYNVTRTWE